MSSQIAVFIASAVFFFCMGFAVGFYYLKKQLDEMTAGILDFSGGEGDGDSNLFTEVADDLDLETETEVQSSDDQ